MWAGFQSKDRAELNPDHLTPEPSGMRIHSACLSPSIQDPRKTITRSRDVVWLVQCLPRIYESLNLIFSTM